MSHVEVVRGDLVESRHSVHVAVCDAEGRPVAAVGDVRRVTYYRSAAKPMQALPLVEEGVVDAIGLTDAELALCCASHEGEAAHVDGARSILEKAGLDEDLLACGAHAPYSQVAAAALAESGQAPLRIHNNCSGKHAGMLALAAGMGWEPAGYHLPTHPVQLRMAREIERWSGVPAEQIRTGVDGCGVVCFGVPLDAMATSFARFARAAQRGEAAGRIVAAMTGHPYMVGGTGRTCTDVMDTAGNRVFVKLGAEGVYAGGLPGRGWGFAIKVEDGGRRGVEVALIEVLRELEVLDAERLDALSGHGRPALRNTRGEVVGELRPAFSLHSNVPGGR